MELGSKDKIATLGKGVREVLVEASDRIGCLLLYSRQEGLNLKFKELKYGTCVRPKSLELDAVKLVQQVRNNSHRPVLSKVETVPALESSYQSFGNP